MSHTAIASPARVAQPAAGPATTADAGRWTVLFRVAGVGALLTAILIPLQIVAFIAWPLPTGGVLEWFELFQESPIVALISYDLVLLLEEVLLIPIIAGLTVVLLRSSPSLAITAAGLWLVSVALFIGSNTAFDMLALSGGYAEAASGAERAAYLAAGQTALTGYMEFGTAFVVGYLLASIAGVLVGIAMLRSAVFPAIAGWAAIVANVLGLALFAPGVGVLLSIVSVLILIAWYAAIGWRFLRFDLSPDRPPAPVAN